MSDMGSVAQRAVILWLSGTQLADIHDIPEVQSLVKSGAMAELIPGPITGPLAQAYQAFSGRSPASFGFFDTLVPHNYIVVEETSGRGGSPKLLPDLLRTVGWIVQYEELALSELASHLHGWTQNAPTTPTCFIAKCAPGTTFDKQILGQALQSAQAWLGESGLLAIVSETHPAPVTRFVNLNNFLAEMGILERTEQGGDINWSNSLAYFAGHGQLWVNLLGRDPQGAVHPQDEYEEVRDSLIKALPRKLLDNGQEVIERVYRKEELYSSEYLFCLPDLVVVFKPGYAPSPQSSRLAFDAATFTPVTDGRTVSAGVHPSCVKGLLLASAPAFAHGVATTEEVPLTAVIPTVLHALGVEYVDMETPAVSELFSPAYLQSHPIRSSMQSQELSEEDEELIVNHLRDLGYV